MYRGIQYHLPMTIKGDPVEGSAPIGRRRVKCVRADSNRTDNCVVPLRSRVDQGCSDQVVSFIGVGFLLYQNQNPLSPPTIRNLQQITPTIQTLFLHATAADDAVNCCLLREGKKITFLHFLMNLF